MQMFMRHSCCQTLNARTDALAERHRREGEMSSALGAQTSAAENFPHLIQLRTLTANFDPSTPIAWLAIIYPNIAK